MLKRVERNLIVGLDIGTSKVVALVGEVGLDGSIELLGLGSQPSRGLKKGVVVNIESTVQSIQRAVEEAELMAGCEIHSVFAGIAGSHVRSLNSHGVVGVRDKEVSHGDVEPDDEVAFCALKHRDRPPSPHHGRRCRASRWRTRSCTACPRRQCRRRAA